MSVPDKFCPLRGVLSPCVSNCAWYLPNSRECSIVMFGKEASERKEKVDRLQRIVSFSEIGGLGGIDEE